MSLLNVTVSIQSYLDAAKTNNPMNLLANIKPSLMGLASSVPRMIPVELAPQETLTFSNNSRSLSYSGSTSFAIAAVSGTDRARLRGAFGARTARAYGDSTTQWAVTKNGNTTRFTATGTGTVPTFSGMQAGDGLTVEVSSAFSPANWGDFTLTAVGSNYVEFINPTSIAETVTEKVAVYSSGPVQVGDTLDLSATQFSYANRGQFVITRVTDTYVEFTNANLVVESGITGVTSGLAIYTSFHNWMLVCCDQKIVVRVNGDNGSSVEVEPPAPGDLAQNPGIYLKRGRVYQVAAYNPGQVPVSGFIFLAQ